MTRPTRVSFPAACPFHPRCPRAIDVCPSTPVELWPAGPERSAACVHVSGSPVSTVNEATGCSRCATVRGVSQPPRHRSRGRRRQPDEDTSEVVALVGESGAAKEPRSLERSPAAAAQDGRGAGAWRAPATRSARSARAPANRAADLPGPPRCPQRRQTIYEAVAEACESRRWRVMMSSWWPTRWPEPACARLTVRDSISLRALGRPAPARGHRRGDGPQPELWWRRAGVEPRCVRPRRDPRAERKLTRETGVGILVVTHDLGLAWNIADRVAVMLTWGRIVEEGQDRGHSPRRQASVHTGAAVGGCRRSRRWSSGSCGEDPDPSRITYGLRFPSSLSAARVGRGGAPGHRGALPQR